MFKKNIIRTGNRFIADCIILYACRKRDAVAWLITCCFEHASQGIAEAENIR